MININDLRVSNLFYDVNLTPCYFAGAWERKDGWIGRDSAGNTYKEQEMYPIPLTPEILEKAGFVFDNSDSQCWRHKSSGFSLGDSEDRPGQYYVHGIYLKANRLVYLKYVHHLQNIIHALTGQELEIKL